MRVLITGCGGFVGKHLCSCLEKAEGMWKEAELFACVYNEEEKKRVPLPEKQIFISDIRDYEQIYERIEKINPDYVIHLAAQSSVALSFQQPELTMAVNVTGTENLLQALEQVNKEARILLIGSIDQYGNVPKEEQPIKETHPLVSRSPYGESKIKQEALACKRVKEKGQQIVLARSATHVGWGQATTFAIADWVSQVKDMKAGKRPHKLTVGNLDVVRDIADVRDVAWAYLNLLQKGTVGEIYNVSTGRGVCLKDIPPLLGKLAGIDDLEVSIDPKRFRPADIPILVADNHKIYQDIGWRPKYSLEQTLREWLEI